MYSPVSQTPRAQAGETPLLESRSLERTFMVSQGLYRPSIPLKAVRGVDLALRRGEVLGIVGESGCGKSTLARLLLGLDKPTEGEILFDGRPLSGVRRSELARRIQPIFQDPYSSLNPRKTVSSIVSLPLRVHRIGGASDWRKRTREMLDLVGLPARVHENYPNQLSGGQRQRVAIARALIMNPEIVICDEPTSALDVSVQAQILNLLQDLRQEFNLTYVLISHNLAVVEHLADRVCVMYLGRVVEQANTDVLFRSPRHPYTKTLLDSVLLPIPGRGLPARVSNLVFPNALSLPGGCTFHPRCGERLDCCNSNVPAPRDDEGVRVECHLYESKSHIGELAR